MKTVFRKCLILLFLLAAVSTSAMADSRQPAFQIDKSGDAQEKVSYPTTPFKSSFCCCWNVADYDCANLDLATANNHAWWCGDYFPACVDDVVGGYGNDWDCRLDKIITVGNPMLATIVTVTANINYDTEPGYDYLRFAYMNQIDEHIYLDEWDGEGRRVPVNLTFTIPPSEYLGATSDQIHLRWRFTSDLAWSDKDCFFPSGGGAQVDSITVTATHEGAPAPFLVSFEDNEGTTNEWHDAKCVDVPTIRGSKWEDRNCDGVQDAGEFGIPNWQIRLYSGNTLVDATWTNAQGNYVFCDMPEGLNYRVVEVPRPPMLQTFPPQVKYTVDIAAGSHLTGLDFGNAYCSGDTTCIDTLIAGRIDDFNTGDGDEWTTVSTALDSFISLGGGAQYKFDVITNDKQFGYSFSDSISECWLDAENGCVTGASLEIHLKAGTGQTETDGFALRKGGVSIWNSKMNDLQDWITGGDDNTWSDHDEGTFLFDLANMPFPVNGCDNILAALQDGSLDVTVGDETGVDYIILTIEVCTTSDGGSTSGKKWIDSVPNGIWDPAEDFLADWPIRLYSGPVLVDTTRTDSMGRYAFFDLPAGTYRVMEAIGDSMVQTWPHTVFHTVEVNADISTGFDFANFDYCDFVLIDDPFRVGRIDDFNTGDGDEVATPSPELVALYQELGYPTSDEFDTVLQDKHFIHTFYDSTSSVWQNDECINGANLIISLAAGATQGTDALHFRENGELVWSSSMNDLQSYATGGLDTLWAAGDTTTFTLDLANLPPWLGVTNVLAALHDGDFDVICGDDTSVDFVSLQVQTCNSNGGSGVSPLPDRPRMWARAYPNPFNPTTRIEFNLVEAGHANLTIYDLKGHRVTTLLNEVLPASQNSVTWDGRDNQGRTVSAGVYFYRLKSGTVTLTGKLALIK